MDGDWVKVTTACWNQQHDLLNIIFGIYQQYIYDVI